MQAYRVIGSDGREYGPVNPQLLRTWLSEGRVNAATRICLEGSSGWRPLGTLPEFQSFVAGVSPVTGLAPAMPAGYRVTNTWAVVGFVCGVLSVTLGLCCCCCLPVDLFGIVCSAVALVQISRNAETQSGTTLAIIGLTLSLLSFLAGSLMSALWMAGGGAAEVLQGWEQEFSFGGRLRLGF